MILVLTSKREISSYSRSFTNLFINTDKFISPDSVNDNYLEISYHYAKNAIKIREFMNFLKGILKLFIHPLKLKIYRTLRKPGI
jgi:hypothetical protein